MIIAIIIFDFFFNKQLPVDLASAVEFIVISLLFNR